MMSGKAPEFDLPLLEGGRRKLSELLSQGPVLLVFYKASCPTCQLTFPFLERLSRAAGPETPSIVAISQDDAAAAREFNRRFGISLPTLLDTESPGYPVSNAFKITNVPSLFLVETDGRISRVVSGFDKAEMERFAARYGTQVFTSTDRVPAFRPG